MLYVGFIENRALRCLCLLAICCFSSGCSDDSKSPPSETNLQVTTPDPVPEPCGGLVVETPAEGAILTTSDILVTGQTGRSEIAAVQVNGSAISTNAGAFETTISSDDGVIKIEVECEGRREVRQVRVVTVKPALIVESPISGTIMPLGDAAIEVAGHVINSHAAESLTLNGQMVELDRDGRFRIDRIPQLGMNHFDFVLAPYEGDDTDQRRSLLYGIFTPWSAPQGTTATATIQSSGFEKAARALETTLTPDYVQQLVIESMDADSEFQVHEVRFERAVAALMPSNGQINVELYLYDLAVRMSYQYMLFGNETDLTGWVHSRPGYVRAEVVIHRTDDGRYNMTVQNPSVELNDFELELDSFYEAAQDAVEGPVARLAQAALLSALTDLTVEDLFPANILDLEVDLFEQRTELNLTIDELAVTPDGIEASSSASIEPFEPVYEAPGYWTHGNNLDWMTGDHDISLGLSIDIFNRLLGEAWRGGTLDLNVADLVGEDDPITVGFVAGPAGPALRENLSLAAPIRMDTYAPMQAIAQLDDPEAGELVLRFGALEVKMLSENLEGAMLHWATVEVSLEFTVQPRFSAGGFALDSNLETRVELVDAPAFPIAENGFEDFLETTLGAIAGNALDEFAESALSLSDLNILGLGVGSVTYGTEGAGPGVLVLGIDLAISPPATPTMSP